MFQTPSTTWPMCLTVLYLGEAQLVFGDSVTRFDIFENYWKIERLDHVTKHKFKGDALGQCLSLNEHYTPTTNRL